MENQSIRIETMKDLYKAATLENYKRLMADIEHSIHSYLKLKEIVPVEFPENYGIYWTDDNDIKTTFNTEDPELKVVITSV